MGDLVGWFNSFICSYFLPLTSNSIVMHYVVYRVPAAELESANLWVARLCRSKHAGYAPPNPIIIVTGGGLCRWPKAWVSRDISPPPWMKKQKGLSDTSGRGLAPTSSPINVYTCIPFRLPICTNEWHGLGRPKEAASSDLVAKQYASLMKMMMVMVNGQVLLPMLPLTNRSELPGDPFMSTTM